MVADGSHRLKRLVVFWAVTLAGVVSPTQELNLPVHRFLQINPHSLRAVNVPRFPVSTAALVVCGEILRGPALGTAISQEGIQGVLPARVNPLAPDRAGCWVSCACLTSDHVATLGAYRETVRIRKTRTDLTDA